MKFLNLFFFIYLGASLASAKVIPNLAEEVKSKLKNNPSTAFAWIEDLGQPSEVCDLYNQAVRDLYWLDKGAKNLVVVGERGIAYCLQQATQSANTNPEVAIAFKAQAKTIAYNVAANSWPGWGDEGVSITTSETQAGLEAAKLNLSLAIELKKPDDKIASAFWLLSAMQLALGNYTDALKAIDQSVTLTRTLNDKTTLAYYEGFKGLILLSTGKESEGNQLLESNISILKDIGSDDASSYIAQLETGRKIFVK